MKLDAALMNRAQYKCELCAGEEGLAIHEIQPRRKVNENSTLIICSFCDEQLTALRERRELDADHWRCLAESMQSEFAPVQLMSYRLLAALKDQDWAQDLLGQMTIDDELANWALAGLPIEEDPEVDRPLTFDCENTPLFSGDTARLIQEVEVEGAGFTLERGTEIKNLSLTDDPAYVLATVNGVEIVLVAAFLRKE